MPPRRRANQRAVSGNAIYKVATVTAAVLAEASRGRTGCGERGSGRMMRRSRRTLATLDLDAGVHLLEQRDLGVVVLSLPELLTLKRDDAVPAHDGARAKKKRRRDHNNNSISISVVQDAEQGVTACPGCKASTRGAKCTGPNGRDQEALEGRRGGKGQRRHGIGPHFFDVFRMPDSASKIWSVSSKSCPNVIPVRPVPSSIS